MKFFNSVILLLLTVGTSVNCYIQHYGNDVFDVTIHVKFTGTCNLASDITTIVTGIPRGSSILNVLEHANTQFPVFFGFEVLYGVHNTSYTLVGINGEATDTSCSWYVSTDPVTSSEAGFFPLSDVLVTNVGMEVTFNYQSSSEKKVSPQTAAKRTVNNQLVSPIGHIDYILEGTLSCSIDQVGFPSTPLQVSFMYGESALNIIESAMNLEPNYNVVLQNIFGTHYIVKSFNSHDIPGCMWCPYFTPPAGSQYSLTATINNFIIPLTGGTLTYKYEQACGSSAGAFHEITNRYKPFMKKGDGSNDHCHEEEEDCKSKYKK